MKVQSFLAVTTPPEDQKRKDILEQLLEMNRKSLDLLEKAESLPDQKPVETECRRCPECGRVVECNICGPDHKHYIHCICGKRTLIGTGILESTPEADPVLDRIRDLLFLDMGSDGDFYNPDKEVDSDTMGEVVNMVREHFDI